MPESDFAELIKKSISTIKELLGKEPLGVTGVNKVKENWEVLVEVLERKAVPDSQDIIGKYLLVFSKDKKLLSYNKTGTRHRGDIGEVSREETAEEEAKKK